MTMSPAEYHRDPCDGISLSVSIAQKIIMEAPIKAWMAHPKLGNQGKPPTRDMQFGTVCHHKFSGVAERIAVIDAEDYKAQAARESRDAALANNQTPILAREIPEAEAIAKKARQACMDAGLALAGKWEQVVVWDDDGTICRAMMDHLDLNTPYILDLKTTGDANPDNLGRAIVGKGYDIQAAAYISAAEKLRPDMIGKIPFYFLFIETEYPHLNSIVQATESIIQLGASRWCRAREIWNRCLAADNWPGYPKGIQKVYPPPWALQHEMEHGSDITAI